MKSPKINVLNIQAGSAEELQLGGRGVCLWFYQLITVFSLIGGHSQPFDFVGCVMVNMSVFEANFSHIYFMSISSFTNVA